MSNTDLIKGNTDKIKQNKYDYKAMNFKIEKKTKEALGILLNLRTNIYQRIYYLITTEIDSWKNFNFLSSEKKVNDFIDKLEREIKIVKSDNFNFEKYRPAILCIVGKGASKFNEAIIKNMYIAKLQNIIFIIKKAEEGEGISEVKENSIGI